MDRPGVVGPPERPGRLPLTTIAAMLLGVCAAIDVGRIYAEQRYFEFVRKGTFGFYDPIRYASRAHQVNVLAAAAELMVLPTGIVFILWFRRAYGNLPGLGIRNLRWSPGWAVGAWFVPFLNLVRPVRIAADIWRCSEPTLPRQASRTDGPVSPVLSWWWATSLGSGVAFAVASLISRNATSSSDLETASGCRLIGEATSIAAAVFAILLVADVARRQKLRAGVLAGEVQLWSGALQTHSLTRSPTAPARQRDVESLATPDGTPCPSCGFENHPFAPTCLRCHTRLEPQV